MNNIVATKDGMSVTPMTNIQGLPAMGTKRAIYTGDAAMDSGMAYLLGELEICSGSSPLPTSCGYPSLTRPSCSRSAAACQSF